MPTISVPKSRPASEPNREGVTEMPSSARQLDDRRRRALGPRLYTDIFKDIQQLILRLVSSIELRPLLEEVLDATMALHGADFGTVQLYNQQTRVLEIVAQRGFERDFLDHFRKVDDSASVCGRAVQAKARVIVLWATSRVERRCRARSSSCDQ